MFCAILSWYMVTFTDTGETLAEFLKVCWQKGDDAKLAAVFFKRYGILFSVHKIRRTRLALDLRRTQENITQLNPKHIKRTAVRDFLMNNTEQLHDREIAARFNVGVRAVQRVRLALAKGAL